jgi:hypothetical protein
VSKRMGRRLPHRLLVLLGILLAVAGTSIARAVPAAAATTGPAWTQQVPDNVSPEARHGGAMAADYNVAYSDVLLFGGYQFSSGNDFNDTWTWDGFDGHWSQQLPANSPAPRHGASMAYDSNSGTIVLFGGARYGSCPCTFGDTWTWDGTNWTQRFPATSPSARQGAALATDPSTGQVLLVGGRDASDNLLGDTWRWDGVASTWVNTGQTITPVEYAGIADDAATGTVVLFSDLAGETWTWDGSGWTHRFPATSPPSQCVAGMSWAGYPGNVVLAGGAGDTWTWDGTNWTQQHPATSPPGRCDALMAYDNSAGNVTLFGGSTPDNFGGYVDYGDTWGWDGHLSSTTRLISSANPSSVARSVTYTARVAASSTTATGAVVFADGGTTITGCASVPVTSNQARCTVTYNSARNHAITATYSGDSTYLGSTGSLTQAVVTGPTHFRVGAPTAATAGTPFTFTVTALDQDNHTYTGYTGTVKFASTDPSAVLPASAHLTKGVGTFSATLKRAGNRTISAIDTVTAAVRGASTAIAVSAAGLNHLGLTPASSTIAPGASQTYAATAYDAYGNSRGSVTAQTKFTISPNGPSTGASCSANVCTAVATGIYAVVGTDAGKVGHASLKVQ